MINGPGWLMPERNRRFMAASSSSQQLARSGMGGIATLTTLAAILIACNLAVGQSSTPRSPAHQRTPADRSLGPRAGQQTFSSAAEASTALVSALQSNDQQALAGILGSDAKDIISSGDETEDASDRAQFVEKYQQMHRLVTEPDGATTLYI